MGDPGAILAQVVLVGLAFCVWRREEILAAWLVRAARAGNATTVRRLLRWGGDPNARDAAYTPVSQTPPGGAEAAEAAGGMERRWTPVLTIAVEAGREEVVDVLLAAGAHPLLEDLHGRTPLAAAETLQPHLAPRLREACGRIDSA